MYKGFRGKLGMVKRITKFCKIGTHSTEIIVLWKDKPLVKGERVKAMKLNTYNQLPASLRNKEDYSYWENYYIEDITETGFLFLHL